MPEIRGAPVGGSRAQHREVLTSSSRVGYLYSFHFSFLFLILVLPVIPLHFLDFSFFQKIKYSFFFSRGPALRGALLAVLAMPDSKTTLRHAARPRPPLQSRLPYARLSTRFIFAFAQAGSIAATLCPIRSLGPLGSTKPFAEAKLDTRHSVLFSLIHLLILTIQQELS